MQQWLRVMSAMGFKAGKGLGKRKQGRIEPIARAKVVKAGTSLDFLNEAKAAGVLKENAIIRIPVTLMDNAEDGLVRVEAIAYFCEDDGPCQVSGVLFEVPVALGQTPGKPVRLRHTFISQAAQFGFPIGETP